MIPRTVLMAQEVAAQSTATELETNGNVILNGYLSVVSNTINKKAWQYQETLTAPVDLPSLSKVRPALKGWSTNYMQYYTQKQPNAYGVAPGDPTMFDYTVHSFSVATGTIASVGNTTSGAGYTTGAYVNLAAVGGSGTGATLDIIVSPSGSVSSVTLNNPGTDYRDGDILICPSIPGAGDGFSVTITSINVVNPSGVPRWSQVPRRYFQNQVAAFVPPTANQEAIPYSFIYPVADNPTAPPIDIYA